MATQREPLLGWNLIPDDSADVFIERASVKQTNGVWPYLVLIMNDSTSKVGVNDLYRIPEPYVSTPVIRIDWTSTAITGNVVFEFDYRKVSSGESFDQTGQQGSDSVTLAAPSAAHLRQVSTLSLTGTFAVDDLLQFFFARNSAAAGDTMSGPVIVHELSFQFSDA